MAEKVEAAIETVAAKPTVEATPETTNLYDAIDGMKPEVPEEAPEQRESTITDYAKVVNPVGIVYNNPELAYKASMGSGGVDLKDPSVMKIYEEADGPGKLALSKAVSTEHFMVIAGRRKEFEDASKAIEQDPLLVQLGMGALPAILSPTSALPFGAVGTVVKLGKQVSAVNRALLGAAVGGATGAAANVADEMLLESQGIQNDKMSAFVYGLGFGALLGGLGSSLAGPNKASHAHNLSSEGDTFTADFARDPHLEIQIEDGAVKITGVGNVEGQRKSWLDQMPLLGKWLRSDINTIYQSQSAALRAEATKWFAPTVSMKDAKGNSIPQPWNAQNEKGQAKGYYNTLMYKINDIHARAKEAGYKGSKEDFVADLSREYTAAISRQENAVYQKLITVTDEIKGKYKTEKDTRLAEIDANRPVYKMPDGTERELNEQDLLDLQENVDSKAEYDAVVSQIAEHNAKIDSDIDVLVKQMRDEGKFAASSKKKSTLLEKEAKAKLKEDLGDEYLPAPPPWVRPKAIINEKVELKPKPQLERDKLKEELDVELSAKSEQEFTEARNKIYDEHKGTFEGSDHIKEGAEAYREYYINMLEHGKKAGTKELSNVSPNRLYRPRVWNFEQAKALPQDTVKATLRRALSAHPNQAGYTAEMLDTSVDTMYEMLQAGAFDLENLSTTFVVPKHLPFEASLKNKKWKVDESKLGELLKDNMEDTTGAYSFKMAGRFAANKVIGDMDWKDYMKDFEDRLIAEGSKYTKEELQAFSRSVEDTVGTLRMNTMSDSPAWQFARNLGSYNSLRLGGGFGGNQFIELAANLMSNGLNSLIDGRFSKTWQNAGRLLYKGKKVDDQFTESFIASGLLDTALHDTRVNRYSDAEMGLNPGFVEKALFKGQDMLMKVNGMRYFTAVMEDQAGGSILVQLKDFGNKSTLTTTETARLARWGMSHSDAKVFAEDLAMYYDPKEGRLELDKFSEVNRIKFQQAIQNGVGEMVIQGDSIHLPNWMKAPSPVVKLLTQFMRFPLIAQEVLTRKGMQEEQLKFMTGVMASVTTYMALKYVREQAAISAGFTNEVDAKYDYFGTRGEEARRNAAMQALNYTAPLGFMSSLWNYGAIATGNPELGRDFVYDKGVSAIAGPTGSLIDDAFTLFTSAANGELGSQKDQMVLKGMGPLLSLPIVSEGARAFIQQ